METANMDYLTTRQAADALGLKPSTLEAWRVRGDGPKFGKFGRAVRYRADDLQAWAESRLRDSTSSAA